MWSLCGWQGEMHNLNKTYSWTKINFVPGPSYHKQMDCAPSFGPRSYVVNVTAMHRVVLRGLSSRRRNASLQNRWKYMDGFWNGVQHCVMFLSLFWSFFWAIKLFKIELLLIIAFIIAFPPLFWFLCHFVRALWLITHPISCLSC